MKYILSILIIFFISSCDNDPSTKFVDINDYFIIELPIESKSSFFTREDAKGYDVEIQNINTRFGEVVFSRDDRSLAEHVQLYPKEMIKRKGYELLNFEQYKNHFLNGTYSYYLDGKFHSHLWCLYHENRYLMIIKITKKPNLKVHNTIKQVIDKIIINKTH